VRIAKNGATRVAARITALLLTAGAFAACDTLPPGAQISKTAGVAATDLKPAGENTVGETCHYEPAANNAGSTFSAAYNLFCGSWQQPSGRVFQAANPQSDGALAALAQGGEWRSDLDERFACGEPSRSTILRQAPTALLSCARRSGGWPQIAFVANVGGQTYYADGVPSALPPLETTLAALAGQPVATTRESSAADLVAAAISTKPFGSGDLDRYYTLMRLGNAANDADDFASAEKAFREALAIQQRILGPNDPGLAMPEMHLALQISNQDRYVEADQLFASARRLVASQSDPLLDARYEIYMAEHEANRQRYKEAAAYAARAETGFSSLVPIALLNAANGGQTAFTGSRLGTLADSLFLGPDGQMAVSGLATTWGVEAQLAYNTRDYDQAQIYSKKIAALLKASGLNPPGVAPRSIRVAALSSAGNGDLTDAGREFGVAVNLFSKYEANEHPTTVTLFLAGRTAIAAGNEGDALELFRRGAKIARERHQGLPEGIVSDYLAALESAIRKDPAQSAALSAEFFEAMQLIQGNVTGQVVSQAFARLSAGDPHTRDLLRVMQDSDLELRRLFIQRDALAQNATGDAAAGEIKKIDDQIVAAQTARATAESAAQAASPEYAQLTSAGTSAADIQRVLGPNEGMIEFSIGARASFAALVTKDGIAAYRIDLPAAKAAAVVTALRKTIEPIEENGQVTLPVFDVAGAHALYSSLFGPIDDRIGKLDRLTVIPSGPLTSLPLEVLVTEETKPVTDQNYKDVPFLIAKVAISYTPSPQTLVVQRQHTKPAAGTHAYIGFGDFQPWTRQQLAASFPPDRCQADFEGLSELQPLPGTRKEILAVGNNVFHAPAGDLVLGAAFTKARLTKTDLTQYRVIHLATHAFLPTELRCRPEPLIVLSTTRAAPNVNDSLLGLADILALKLDANLVLLSACNTAGPSGATTGDSLSGLARAFFFAGARGLLVTHWSLDDSAGPLLTALTMTPSGSAQDTATDLRQAKLAMIRKVGGQPGGKYVFFTHPYAWAPFVLVGDGVRAPAPAS
jgi:CHAT domain-containing protein